MTHSGCLSSFVEQDLSCEFLDVVARFILFMFDFEESIGFKFERFLVDFSVSVDDCNRDPECTSFGEEVFLSTGTEDGIFKD